MSILRIQKNKYSIQFRILEGNENVKFDDVFPVLFTIL